jgi:hypothetical protein
MTSVVINLPYGAIKMGQSALKMIEEEGKMRTNKRLANIAPLKEEDSQRIICKPNDPLKI